MIKMLPQIFTLQEVGLGNFKHKVLWYYTGYYKNDLCVLDPTSLAKILHEKVSWSLCFGDGVSDFRLSVFILNFFSRVTEIYDVAIGPPLCP